MKQVKHRHVVVTGGASGIGFAIAARFCAAGHKLTLIGRRREKLEQARAKLSPADVGVVSCDLTRPPEVRVCFEQLGPVDILINNAGAAISAPFLKTERDDWQGMFAINLFAAVNCTEQVLPSMLTHAGGAIINICSTAGLEGYPYVAAYCASKHALLGLTRALAVEYAAKTVSFAAVCPGFTDTELLSKSVAKVAAKTGQSAEQIRAQYLKQTAQGRFTTAQEVAELVFDLCAQPAKQLNGKIARIDGAMIEYVS